MPTKNPSAPPIARASSKASSEDTRRTPSYALVSKVFGIKPAEIPWILCGPGFSPERTADSLASTA